MRDRSLGLLLCVLGLTSMASYSVWAFGPMLGLNWISREMSEWAFRVPVILAVFLFFLIVLWVGYTMVTTPPPLPIERPLEIEKEEVDRRKKVTD